MDKNDPHNGELRMFRDEAAKLLEINKPFRLHNSIRTTAEWLARKIVDWLNKNFL